MMLISLFTLTAAFFGGEWSLWHTFLPTALSLWGGVVLYLNPTSFPPIMKRGIFLPVGAAFAFAALQMFPLLGITHPVYSLTAPMLWPAVSLNVPATLSHLAYAMALGVAACGVYAYTRKNPGSTFLLRGFAMATVVVASYGFLFYAAGNHSVVWLAKRAYGNSLTASFITPSSYATFAGIGLLTCLALFLERTGEISSRLGLVQRVQAFRLLAVESRWPWLAAAVFLYATLLLCGSLFGLASTTFGMAVLFGALAVARRALRWPFLAMAAASLLPLAVIGLLAKSGAEPSFAGLTHIQALAANAMAEYPFTGQGLGTSEDILALQRGSASVGLGPLEHAHSTWLEIPAEMGFPAALLLLGALYITLVMLLEGLTRRRRGVAWPALGVAVMAQTGTHALFSPSLSLPAVALGFLTVMAFSLAQSTPPDVAELPVSSSRRMLLPLLALVVVPFSLWQTWAQFPASRAEKTLRWLDNGTPPHLIAHQLGKARAQLVRAAVRNPYNAEYLYNLGRTEIALAATKSPDAAQVMHTQALRHFEQELTLRPAHSGSWYQLAWLENERGNASRAQTLLANALLTGAYNPTYLMPRASLILTLYPSATPENRTLFATHLANLWGLKSGELLSTIRHSPTQKEQLRQILATNPLRFGQRWHQLTGTDITTPVGITPQFPPTYDPNTLSSDHPQTATPPTPKPVSKPAKLARRKHKR